MKKYIFIAALFISAGAFAQTQDSLLWRQMELEREFNPTVQDANKINSLPSVPQPTIKKANTNYSTWAERATPPLEIALPQPAKIMTDIPFSTKRGYIMLNAGNYANVNGALGYRFIEKEKSYLGFNFLHHSTHGDVNYVQESDPTSNKAYVMDNFGQLKYGHLFNAFKMDIRASYLHSLFNYYGNTFGSNQIFDNENQRLGVFNANIGIESQQSELLNYKGAVDYKNFSTKFGDELTADGIKGNQLDAMIGLNKPFMDGDTKIGVDGRFLTTFYHGDIENYSLLAATPYISFEGLSWNAKLGADVLFQSAQSNKVRVAPNVELRLKVTEHSMLYANILGGFAHNTFLDMMNESRYIHPVLAATVKSSFSIVDIEGGAKIGELNGFRFDIFGGYKQTDDAHFLITNQSRMEQFGLGWTWRYDESLIPIYANLTHSHIGAMIQNNSWAPLNVMLRIKKNFYTVKDLTINGDQTTVAKPYNKPGIEADVRATFEAMHNLKFTLNYFFAGDRWSYFINENVQMDNINDLNLRAVYEISDAFSINMKANNLLFQKYDIWYGHPAQGFNAMGGFTFKF